MTENRAERLPVDEVTGYRDRRERAEYIYKVYGRYLQGKVLDVGCGDAYLRPFVDDYTGVDIVGAPDVRADLDSGVLPFGGATFDCVVCTDVLEHVDALHTLFGELLRCTRRYVVLSLPNCWPPVVKRSLLMSKAGVKFYGLPLKKPMDRHKWFFNISESVDFIRGVSGSDKASNVEVVKMDVFYGKRWKRIIGRFFDADRALNNLFGEALWVVLEKRR